MLLYLLNHIATTFCTKLFINIRVENNFRKKSIQL